MWILSKLLLVVVLMSFSFSGYAQKIMIGFGSTLAPWVMADTDNGILIDIFTEAMEPLGYEIEKYYYPYARRIDAYQAQHVDVVCDINLKNIEQSGLGGYFSGIIYAYENFAFTLKKRDFEFKSIKELGNYSLLSWQGARGMISPEYDEMANSNKAYTETHNQKLQVKMLLKERVDIIQMDEKIFEFYLANLIDEDSSYQQIPIDRFGLFGENPSGFMFRSAQVRNDFVKQIQLMKEDGRFDKIFEKYTRVKPIKSH